MDILSLPFFSVAWDAFCLTCIWNVNEDSDSTDLIELSWRLYEPLCIECSGHWAYNKCDVSVVSHDYNSDLQRSLSLLWAHNKHPSDSPQMLFSHTLCLPQVASLKGWPLKHSERYPAEAENLSVLVITLPPQKARSVLSSPWLPNS